MFPFVFCYQYIVARMDMTLNLKNWDSLFVYLFVFFFFISIHDENLV